VFKFFVLYPKGRNKKRGLLEGTTRRTKKGTALKKSGPCSLFLKIRNGLLDLDLPLFHELRGFEDLQLEVVIDLFQLRVQDVVPDPLCQGEGTEG